MSLLTKIFRGQQQNGLPSSDWRQHKNPDGSIGGAVSKHAVIEDDVYIEISGIVTAGATVATGTRVRCGDIVQADGSVFRLSPYPDDFEYEPVFPTDEELAPDQI